MCLDIRLWIESSNKICCLAQCHKGKSPARRAALQVAAFHLHCSRQRTYAFTMAALNGAEWDAVSPRVDAVLVLYDHDGKTPKRRQFKTLDEGVVAFDRLQQFHAALRVKHRAPPNAEVMVLFARASRRSDVWYAATPK